MNRCYFCWSDLGAREPHGLTCPLRAIADELEQLHYPDAIEARSWPAGEGPPELLE